MLVWLFHGKFKDTMGNNPRYQGRKSLDVKVDHPKISQGTIPRCHGGQSQDVKGDNHLLDSCLIHSWLTLSAECSSHNGMRCVVISCQLFIPTPFSQTHTTSTCESCHTHIWNEQQTANFFKFAFSTNWARTILLRRDCRPSSLPLHWWHIPDDIYNYVTRAEKGNVCHCHFLIN